MERYILVDTLKQHPLELANFPEAQNDDELVRIAVKKNGLALQFASVRLQGDFETVLLAVKKNGASLEFASDTLKANSEIALAAVKSDGKAYAYISNAFDPAKPQCRGQYRYGSHDLPLAARGSFRGTRRRTRSRCRFGPRNSRG